MVIQNSRIDKTTTEHFSLEAFRIDLAIVGYMTVLAHFTGSAGVYINVQSFYMYVHVMYIAGPQIGTTY
jgi:hypothetical protein